jgi:hypothetical protein
VFRWALTSPARRPRNTFPRMRAKVLRSGLLVADKQRNCADAVQGRPWSPRQVLLSSLRDSVRSGTRYWTSPILAVKCSRCSGMKSAMADC